MNPIDTIKKFIRENVFVRQTEQRIVPETAAWIMDFRKVCLNPEFLDAFTDAFYEQFKGRYPFQVGGMEVAAVPLVTAIVMKMRERGMPVSGFFIRKSRKKEGLLKMIEGDLTDAPIILVDDLINSGYTLERQIKALESYGKRVSDFYVLLRFRPKKEYEKYEEQGIRVTALFSLTDFKSELDTNLVSTDSGIQQSAFSAKWYFRALNPRLESVIPKSGIVQDSDNLYFGSDDGIMRALSKKDGSTVWEHRIGFGSREGYEIFATPLVQHERLYFGAYDGNVYCLDVQTGKRIWISLEADWVHGAVAGNADDNRIYVPVVYGVLNKRGGVIALDARTGKKIWSTTLEGAVKSTPVFVSSWNRIVVGGLDGTLSVLHAETGELIWSFKSGGAIQDASVCDPESNEIVFASFDGSVYVLGATDGSLRWKYEVGMANYSTPWIEKDTVFVTSLGKYLHAIDRTTGKMKWRFPARARIFSRPVLSKGSIFFGANDARLYQIDAVTGKQKGYFQVAERVTNPVVIDTEGSDIFLQTYANEVYCLENNE